MLSLILIHTFIIFCNFDKGFIDGHVISVMILSVQYAFSSPLHLLLPVAKSTGYPRPQDDVIKWKHFPRYWPFVRSPVNSPHKAQWRRALMFSLICAWINAWVNNREAGDLRRHRVYYDATVMAKEWSLLKVWECNSTWIMWFDDFCLLRDIETLSALLAFLSKLLNTQWSHRRFATLWLSWDVTVMSFRCDKLLNWYGMLSCK